MEQKMLIQQIDVTWQSKVETAEHLFLKQIYTGSRTGKITGPADAADTTRGNIYMTYSDTDIYKHNKSNNQKLSNPKFQAHIQEHIAKSKAETQTEIRALSDEVKTMIRYFLQQR